MSRVGISSLPEIDATAALSDHVLMRGADEGSTRDREEWAELPLGGAARELGLTVSPEEASRVLGLLMIEPSTRAFVRVEATAPDTDEPWFEFLVPGTRIFINKAQLLDVRGDVLAGIAVWALSHSLTWSAAVGLFQKMTRSVRHLTADEVAVLLCILKAADGDRPVMIDAIAELFDGEQEVLDRELASLLRRGVVWTEGGGWRVAP